MRSWLVAFCVAQILIVVTAKLFVIGSPHPWPLFEDADDLATICYIAAIVSIIASTHSSPQWYFCGALLVFFQLLCLIEAWRMVAEEEILWSDRSETDRLNDVTCYAKLQATKHRSPNANTLQDACRASTNYYSEASYVIPGSRSPSDDGTAWIVFEFLFVAGLTVTGAAICILTIRLTNVVRKFSDARAKLDSETWEVLASATPVPKKFQSALSRYRTIVHGIFDNKMK